MQSGTPSNSAQWHPRDHIALFVRTLHLLDLDRLPDFPNITEYTLRVSAKASSNLQQRVKSIEWSLYRLYEVYDPADTRSRLRPYFPPSTPIQSLNLRAALYKVLTDLKKNGVLPREIVLRKTMLDECKGEKFEELLGAFSMLVLRKTINTSTRGTRTTNPDHVVPLILAYRVSLQTSLRRRQQLQAEAYASMQDLQMQRDDIAGRMEIVAQADQLEDLPVEQYERLRDHVNHAFSADRWWAEYILNGSPSAAMTTQKRSQGPDDGKAHGSQKDPNALMSELVASLAKYEEWTQDLESLRDSLLPVPEKDEQSQPLTTNTTSHAGDHSLTVDGTARPASTTPRLRFDQHQSMTLRNVYSRT
ncbi:HAUS augmin-like complex subunit 6 N-terminus-domain-containing protein [Exophiala viscosa]|uniref:HAUS augmin-like complex subunit 6 N-terminus-domain-containing protein n=1 Tax=Exophiala viscosa TaxID=2486360 RepID=A0AAN6E6B4_9EURO|nr:HAUS augmin-like complex subunit 6 N-terminus-domain-containing protein [Exophiala viscosa]